MTSRDPYPRSTSIRIRMSLTANYAPSLLNGFIIELRKSYLEDTSLNSKVES